jgi:DNA modification methylase
MKLLHGDCLDVMAELPDNSVDCICTDPPYHLTQQSRGGSVRTNDPETPSGRHRLQDKGFMGQQWDGGDIAFRPDVWREALRVAKPGAPLVAFGGCRTHHRLMTAIEDAGWVIRDCLMWMYGCLDDETECLTRRGWVRHNDLREDDWVRTWQPGDVSHPDGQMSWVMPDEIVRYPFDGGMVTISSNYGEQLLTFDHRVHTRINHGNWQVVRACDISLTDLYLIPYLDDRNNIVETFIDSITIGTHYRGVVWCVRVPTGAFVVRRLGRPFITGNSGFPKSMSIGKAIDKTKGAERQVVGVKPGHEDFVDRKTTGHVERSDVFDGFDRPWMHDDDARRRYHLQTAAATPEAKLFDGYNCALKPAYEPVVLAMKPLDGTFADNALRWGVAGLNIEASRVEAQARPHRFAGSNMGGSRAVGTTDQGRWPPNVLLSHSWACTDECADDCPVAEMDRQAPAAGGSPLAGGSMRKPNLVYGKYAKASPNRVFDGHAGASRFFPRFRYNSKVSRKERGDSTHPTMKPIAVTEWLLRLIAPPLDRPQGQPVVLDPFMGSGTTGVAAERLGLDFIGIDREAEYVELARRRIDAVKLDRGDT